MARLVLKDKKVSRMNSINAVNNSADIIQAPVQTVNVAAKKSAEANFTQPVQQISDDIKSENIKSVEKKNDEKLDSKEIHGFVEKANNLVLIFDKSIKFVVDEKSGKKFIDVIDNKTNEVIKKIPPENIRKFVDAIANVVGMIIDKKV